MKYFIFISLILASYITSSYGDKTTWTFDNPDGRFEAKSGTAEMDYYDPLSTGWGANNTTFRNAASFNLPLSMDKDMQVMSFPACTNEQGYQIKPKFEPNGPYGESDGSVSNYT